jgi:hypothetical protein
MTEAEKKKASNIFFNIIRDSKITFVALSGICEKAIRVAAKIQEEEARVMAIQKAMGENGNTER